MKRIRKPAYNYSKSTMETRKKMCKTCSKLTIKSPERRNRLCSAIFTDNFEQIPHIVLAFPIVDFEKVNVYI